MILQLTKLWLTSVLSGESHGWYTDPERDQSYSTKGEIRTYAGGRQRAIGSVGVAGSWKFTLVEMSLADTVILRTWLDAGVTVFARDHRGQSMYGTFFGVDLSEIRAMTYNSPQNLYRASITLQAVDVVEGV
jgi:hypothetical protein